MEFIATLTTWRSCQDGSDPTQCFPELVPPYTNHNGIDNTPEEGFGQLWEALNNGPWEPMLLGWSSDIAYVWDSPPSPY